MFRYEEILGKPTKDGELRCVDYAPLPSKLLKVNEPAPKCRFWVVSKDGYWVQLLEHERKMLGIH